MGYTPQSMAAAAETHYREAVHLRNGDPADVQASIAESLCGLLALGLSNYASAPADFDDDEFDDELDDDELDARLSPDGDVRIRDVHLPPPLPPGALTAAAEGREYGDG
jgi:hypothetical protein